MIAKVNELFQRRNPKREASLALARITTLTDVTALPWAAGVCQERRSKDEIPTAIGVLMAPIPEGYRADDVNVESMYRAVCCNLRATGFGVVSSEAVAGEQFLIAIPNGTDDADAWKFFVADVRHQTARPGGWFLTGLEVQQIHDLSSEQRRHFRPVSTE